MRKNKNRITNINGIINIAVAANEGIMVKNFKVWYNRGIKIKFKPMPNDLKNQILEKVKIKKEKTINWKKLGKTILIVMGVNIATIIIYYYTLLVLSTFNIIFNIGFGLMLYFILFAILIINTIIISIVLNRKIVNYKFLNISLTTIINLIITVLITLPELYLVEQFLLLKLPIQG